MWKCVPRNLRVTRKISRSEKPPGQEIKQVSPLKTRFIFPATAQNVASSSPDNNGKRLTELGKYSWEPQNIAKICKPFERQCTEPCKIVSAIVPTLTTLTQRFNNLTSKGSDAYSERRRKICARRKQRKDKQQESAWEKGSHLEHTWLGALGWSTALVLGWYLIQPLCRLWNFSSDAERKCSRHHRLLQLICNKDNRHDSRYISLVGALSRTAWAQPLSVLSRQQTEKLTLLEDSDSLTADQSVKNFSESTGQDHIYGSAVPFGPPTAEEALNEAADTFFKAHNSAMGDIDNSMGVTLMQQGRHSEALGFFTRGMEYNNSVATYNLAVCYEKGLGTNQDLKKAAKYYKVASDRGHATAMYNLGVFHIHGWGGLPVDFDEAYGLFEKASALGQNDAKKALDMVAVDDPVTPVENNMSYDESTHALLHALGLVQTPFVNEDCSTENVQSDLYTCVNHEESPEFVKLSNGSEIDVKDLSQLLQDTILKYQVCH